MASPPLLQFDALTAPLPAGDPGSPAVFRDLRGDFAELIREEDPHAFPEGDPQRDNPKKANWQAVVDLAREALTRRSKDLRIAAWLTAGLTQVGRFAGLRDGLRLLNLLVSDCWERLNPPVEDNDPRERGEAIANILDADSGPLRLPGQVRLLPIARGDRQEYGSYHLGRRHEGASVDPKDLEQARARLSPADCRQLAEDVAGAADELDRLRAALAIRIPSGPPSFDGLRAALQECQADVEELLRAKSVPEPPPGPPAGEPPAGGAPAGNGAGRAAPLTAAGDVAAARRGVYEQLLAAADRLEQLEGPISPIADVIRKVARWGQMPYRDLRRTKVLDVLDQVVTHSDSTEG